MSLKLNEEKLVDLLEGTLQGQDRADLVSHLEQCDECRQAWEELQVGHRTWSSIKIRSVINLIPELMPRLQNMGSPTSPATPRRFLIPILVLAAVVVAVVVALALFVRSSPAPREEPHPGNVHESHTVPEPFPPAPALPIAAAPSKPSPEHAQAARLVRLPGRGAIVQRPGTVIESWDSGFRLKNGAVWCDLTPGQDPPFEVVCGAARIVVLGTAFGVRLQDDRFEVALFRGSISVTIGSDPARVLVPGDILVLSGEKAIQTRINSGEATFWNSLAREGGLSANVGNTPAPQRPSSPKPSPVPEPATATTAVPDPEPATSSRDIRKILLGSD